MKQGWELKKLGEVCNFSNGLWKGKKEPFIKVGVIRNTNFTKNCLLDNSDIACLEVEERLYQKKKLEFGDLLVERSGGGPKQPVGRVVAFELYEGEYSFSNFTSVIRINNKSEIDYRFLHKFFLLFYITGQTEKIQSNTIGIRNLDFNKFKETLIPIPPLSEQQRIVEILDNAFAKIDTVKQNAERNRDNAKELFQSVLDFELSLKKDWIEKKLSDITDVKDGTHDSPKYIEKGIPFVTQKNIKSTGLNFDDTKFIKDIDHEKFYKRSDVSFGDILISMIGANRGMAAIVDDKRVFSIKNVGLIKKSENINQYFLLYFLKSPVAAKYVLDNSNGGAQEFIGLTSLRKFPVPTPPLSEQQAIVSKLDALSEKCKTLENNYLQTIKDCNELKKAILTKAFNGEL